MSASHEQHNDSNELSTAQLIIVFLIFSFLLIWLGDTFTATVGILGEILIFIYAYNEKHKLID
jgi:accessory gene regulator protein AgrB